jgi:hypothetical protein
MSWSPCGPPCARLPPGCPIDHPAGAIVHSAGRPQAASRRHHARFPSRQLGYFDGKWFVKQAATL